MLTYSFHDTLVNAGSKSEEIGTGIITCNLHGKSLYPEAIYLSCFNNNRVM